MSAQDGAPSLATHELSRRLARKPDYQAENEALKALAHGLAHQPDRVVPRLIGTALGLCRAGSVGVSLLEQDPSGGWVFRWTHLAGELAPHVGGCTPRDFSPCGVTLERGYPQLFHHPERYFTYFARTQPAIVEGLVIPMWWNDEPLGTIWVVSHDDARVFDREDVRIMEGFAALTAVAIPAATFMRQAEAAARPHVLSERTTQIPVAAQTQGEQSQNEWLRQLIGAQEQERQRIARDLHDQLGRHVTGLALRLHALDPPRVDRSSIEGLQQIVSDIDLDMRRIVRDLRPAALLDVGLTGAMRAYVDEWSQQSGIAADFYGDGGDALPGYVETTLYRILQEALMNVGRHARARRVRVVLEQQAGHLISIVEDDGIGFDFAPSITASDGRLGLIGMRERAALIGGLCTIESQPGAGTTVFVKVPLDLHDMPEPRDVR